MLTTRDALPPTGQSCAYNSAHEASSLAKRLAYSATYHHSERSPHFGKLQNSLGGRGGKLHVGNVIMLAFDLLDFDGRDIRSLELTARTIACKLFGALRCD